MLYSGRYESIVIQNKEVQLTLNQSFNVHLIITPGVVQGVLIVIMSC